MSFCLLAESKSQVEEVVCTMGSGLVGLLMKVMLPARPVLSLRTDQFWKGQLLPS